MLNYHLFWVKLRTQTHTILSVLCGGCTLRSNLLLRNCTFVVRGTLSKRPVGYLPLILQHRLCLIMQGDRRPARPLISEYSSWYRPSVPVFLRSARLPVACCQSLTYHVSSGSWDVNESLIQAVWTCNKISQACPHQKLTQCYAYLAISAVQFTNVHLWMYSLESFKFV